MDKDDLGKFPPWMGCVDHIHTLQLLLHQHFIHRLDTFAVFLDFIAAFDLILWALSCQIMLKDSVPTKIVDLLRAYDENILSNLWIYGELMELFEIAHGVHQGCLALPFFFNYVID